MSSELAIQVPGRPPQRVALTEGRVTVGRSSVADLCFPEDAGLSRQHFAFASEGGEWTVQDLGSKNGTYVNNIPLRGRLVLKPGDRITAGHLVIMFSPDPGANTPERVVVFDREADATDFGRATLVTSLEASAQAIHESVAVPRGPQKMSPTQALIQAGQVLSVNRPLEDLFPVILDLAVQAVGAERGVLMTLEGDSLTLRANKGEGFHISSRVRDMVLQEKSSILVRDAQLDDAFKGRMSIVEQKVHTMMGVPLQTNERIIGLIYVDSPFVVREFSKGDLSLLTVMANVAAIRIENARLAQIEEADRIMQRDLSQAAEIQRGMLPAEAPSIRGADVAGFNVACRTVGGDYYGFFKYGDGSVGLALGDVSGKGMPASLMMMALHARVQVLSEDPHNLAAFMSRLNKATCENCPSNRFITFFFSVLDAATGELRFANAGHNPPVIVSASGEARFLNGGGPVLGVLPIAPYTEMRAAVEPGGLLALYSDGVTEAANTSEEEFGEARLMEVLAQHRTESAASIVQAVTSALSAFTGNAPQADDITLVIAKRV